jgi:hypothetical protein
MLEGKGRPESGPEAEAPGANAGPIYTSQMFSTRDSEGRARGSLVLLPRSKGRMASLKFQRALSVVASLGYPLYLIADRIAHVLGFCLGG